MKKLIALQVNGESHQLAIPPHWTLLEALRYEARLTGSKQGCDKGDCGACTVLIDGEPALACCTLAVTQTDRQITTIEGLADQDGPTAVQRAFDACGALQCGFCQPGMILSAESLLKRNPNPSLDEIKTALSGNLCRCTGYTKIYEAIQMAAAEPAVRHRPMIASSPADGFQVIGSRGRKADSIGKATGNTLYTDDIALPRMAHGKILRSPHAHARIRSIDTRAAEALPGVYAVMTGGELPTRYCVIPWTADETTLAIDKVRYVGEGVAAVAACDEDTANEALRNIVVDYEVLEPVLSPTAALDDDAPLVHETDSKDRPRKDNLCKTVDLEFGNVDESFERAVAIVEDRWLYTGSNHAAIEPHCAIGTWSADGQLTLYSATQVMHYLHRELAKVLEIPASKIKVIQPAIGGAFGGKSEPFDLEICAAWLSKKAGRPVKILYTREEVFYSHRGRHPMAFDFKIGADAEGRITAVSNDILIDGGAYHSFGLVTTYYAGQLLPGPVKFETYKFRSRRVYTNKPCCGPKRGHGSVQPRFPLETALDDLADQLSIDPIEIRRRNAMRSGEMTVNGMLVPSCGILECLDLVESASKWRERHDQLPPGHGLGVATSMYISGTAYPVYPNEMPQSAVILRGDRSGKITAFTGTNDIGQGSDGVIARIVAEETGVVIDNIVVVSGDTDLTPVDLGAYSSRVTFMAGTATIEAAKEMRAYMQAAVATRLEIGTEQVLVTPGWYVDADDPERRVSVKDAMVLAEEQVGTLSTSGGYRTRKVGAPYRGGTIGASPAYSVTAHVVEAKVDPETGQVQVVNVWAAHDCGRALHPVLVEGQIEGSVYMGISEALTEEHGFDDKGLHTGPNLLDYRISTSLDTPNITAHIVESIDPGGPYGAKEAGEGPLHPAIPALANAIRHATGARMRIMPFTPERVLAGIESAREGGYGRC